MIQSPLSEAFFQAAVESITCVSDFSVYALNKQLPTLRSMVTLWHDGLNHGNYVHFCYDGMTQLRDDLYGGMTVGRFVDAIDVEYLQIKDTVIPMEGYDVISGLVDDIRFLNDQVLSNVMSYAGPEYRTHMESVCVDLLLLSHHVRVLRNASQTLEDRTNALRLWQNGILASDADGAYGPYNTSFNEVPELAVLLVERKEHLIAVHRAYLDTGLAREQVYEDILRLRKKYIALMMHSSLALGGIAGDKSTGPVPQP